ncbi:MAG TPA: NAD(P)-dependent oxidoreductase [Candidatus Polarisedimenticolia bacterium]|nr:NAD(P)-dependent oxidoreductase [Candidatus Polarisedimenticolia bacterium]
MRVLVAGATGVVGKRLVPMLVAAGHEVVGSTQSPEKVKSVTAMGAEPVVLDLLNREAVMKAVVAARPDAVVHQATSLARLRSLRNFDREFELTNRLRTEGTEYLLAAAQK